jgi:hypothetical protein
VVIGDKNKIEQADKNAIIMPAVREITHIN